MVNHQNCDWGQMPHRHGSSDPLYNDVQRFTRKTCPFQRQSDKATLKRSDQNLSNPSNSIPNIKQLVGYAPYPFWAKHNRTCNMSGEPQVTWHVRTVVQPHWPLALAYMSRDVTSHKNPKHSWHDLSCPRCIDGKMMKHVLDSLSTHVISKVSLVYKGNNHWNTPKTGDFGSQLVVSAWNIVLGLATVGQTTRAYSDRVHPRVELDQRWRSLAQYGSLCINVILLILLCFASPGSAGSLCSYCALHSEVALYDMCCAYSYSVLNRRSWWCVFFYLEFEVCLFLCVLCLYGSNLGSASEAAQHMSWKKNV